MLSRRSLRDKLSRRGKGLSSRDMTQVILRDFDLDKEFAVSNNVNSKIISEPWVKSFSLEALEDLGLSVFYRDMLMTFFLHCEDITYNEIRSKMIELLGDHLSPATSKKSPNGIPRSLRKRILRRLTGLLDTLEPFYELLSRTEVHRLIVSPRLNIRLHKVGDRSENIPLFFCIEEYILFSRVLSKRIESLNQGSICIVGDESKSLRIEQVKDSRDNESSFIFKKIASQGVTVLDVIRRQMLSPSLARSITRLLKDQVGGILIYGGVSTGKTSLLAALLSSLSIKRVPLLISCSDEIKSSHPHLHYFNEEAIISATKEGRIEELLDSIAQLGVSDIFIDNASRASFQFAAKAFRRYRIVPVVVGQGKSLDSILVAIVGGEFFSSKEVSEITPIVISLSYTQEGTSIDSIREIKFEHGKLNSLDLISRSPEGLNWIQSTDDSSKSIFFDSVVITEG